MKPVDFKQSNAVYAKDQPQYLPLPVHKIVGDSGVVISCWNMGFLERLKVLFSGRIFVSNLTFNKALQPQRLAASFNDAADV